MARGKKTCKILKEIRRQIAEANDIEFATSECRYKGDYLEISFVGCITQSIYIADSTPLEIYLNSDQSLLDEICLGGAIGPQKENFNIKAKVNDNPKIIKAKNTKRNTKGTIKLKHCKKNT